MPHRWSLFLPSLPPPFFRWLRWLTAPGHFNSCTSSSSYLTTSNRLGYPQVAIGGWHCLALTDRGTMFAWGGNEYGQCALEAGLTGRDIVEPLPVRHVY